MANNKEIAEQVLASVGGASNVKDVTHCMTRLRFMLKDDSIPKDDEVQAIPGPAGSSSVPHSERCTWPGSFGCDHPGE